jgi:uncharacterized RDD family membrane protein YckC
MKLTERQLLILVFITVLCGCLSIFIPPIAIRNESGDLVYNMMLNGFLAPFYLTFFNMTGEVLSWRDYMNLFFYILLLAGLLLYIRNRTEIRLIRFVFSIIFIENAIGLAFIIPSIARIINGEGQGLTIWFFLTYLMISAWCFLSWTILKTLKDLKALSASYYQTGDVLTGVFDEPSRTKRFVNLLVDSVLCILILSKYIMHFNEGWLDETSDTLGEQAFIYITLGVMRLVYYIFFESILAATPGKFLTETRVSNTLGEQTGFLNIVGRTAARMIPFNAFSFLGHGNWHDRLSNTVVLSEANKEQAGRKAE